MADDGTMRTAVDNMRGTAPARPGRLRRIRYSFECLGWRAAMTEVANGVDSPVRRPRLWQGACAAGRSATTVSQDCGRRDIDRDEAHQLRGLDVSLPTVATRRLPSLNR